MDNVSGYDWFGFLTWIVVLGHIYWFYRQWFQGTFYTRDTRIDGKVVLITGANTGIGKYSAIDLARRGGKVYIACRSVSKGEEAKREIIQKSGNEDVHFLQLDLASMKSIRKFAQEFMAKEHKLDILINNAGIFACPQSETEDGFETQFGVNHLGHFLLTNLLMNTIKNSAPARIINVSSMNHLIGKINKSDVMLRKKYDRFTAYNQSKLANVLFTKELARRFKKDKISSFSLHPGVVNTEVFRHVGSMLIIFKPVVDLFSYLFFKSSEAGIQTIIYCALEPGLESKSGDYFNDCEAAYTNPLAESEDLAKWLWKESTKLVKL